MDEAKVLVCQIKTRVSDVDVGKFNWDVIDRDQVNFEFKIMVWFNDDVIPRERKRVQLDILQAPSLSPVETHGSNARATLENSTDKRRSSCVLCVKLLEKMLRKTARKARR